MTDKGKLIRCKVGEIRVAGRNTQGVTLLKTDNDEKVVSVAKVSSSEEEDLEENQEGNNELDNVVNETVN